MGVRESFMQEAGTGAAQWVEIQVNTTAAALRGGKAEGILLASSRDCPVISYLFVSNSSLGKL